MIENKKLDKDLQGKPVDATLYCGMIGSLMYLTSSRPDLNYDVCLCARYQAKPTEKHLQAVKRIFRYLNGTINMGLWYSKDTDMSLTAYADADHAGCQDTRRSTSGSAQFLGDKLVSWSSKKQKSTAISSTEIPLYCDNKSAIALCCNNVQHSRAKHIDICYHFIKEQVENGIVELYFVRTEYQLADIFTKPLPRERFNFLIDKLENQLDIGKCNGRIPRGLKPKEETIQVVLDALALTPCYPAFIITADVPEVYMHQFWNCVYKHDNFYRFRDILQICPRVQGRDFDALPSEEDTLSFLRDLAHTSVINSLNDVVIDQMHQPWRTFAAIINRSLSGKTNGLDKLRLSRAQILWGMYHQKYVDYVELLWEDFTYQIDNKVYKTQEKMYYPQFTKVIIHHFLIQDKTLSWRSKIGMHTSKDDYFINTLRFVSRKEASQIYRVVLPECLTSPEMKESKAYKTYLGHATGVVSPKIARKFKKASPTKKDSDLVPVDEEPIRKGKRVKRSVKKSSTKPTTGIVIREPPVETKSKGKEKEKVDVARGKGIELLSEVALTEKALLKEVRKKSLRDFHKTHPSGSGTGATKPPSVEKITPTVISEGTDDSNKKQEASDEGSRQENESEEQESDKEQDEDFDDDNQEEEEVDQENESEDNEIKTGKEVVQGEGADVEMNEAQQGNENLVTTQEQFEVDIIKKTENQAKMTKLSIIIGHLYNQGFLFSSRAFYWLKPRNCLSAATAPASAVGRLSIHLASGTYARDDVDARLEEPTQTGKEVVQGEGADVEMDEAQQGDEHLETTQEQFVDDAHVTITTVTKKTEVPITSSSRSSDLASKFLNFLDIPQTDAEIVSPLDVHVHHKVPKTQAPTLLIILVSVITESSPAYTNIPQSSQTFTPSPILTTPTPPPTIENTNPLLTLPDFASVF
ncbi:hypothetical protein Tco_0498656 [Tanacetum coccineum]